MRALIEAAAAAGGARFSRAPDNPGADETREAAAEFEAVFVTEMLSHAGFEKALASEAGFGGEAMSGLLLEAYAKKIVERGGFGLADAIARRIAQEGPQNAD